MNSSEQSLNLSGALNSIDITLQALHKYDDLETWQKYWGTDVEMTLLASVLRVAIVNVELVAKGEKFLFLAIPADVDPVVPVSSGGGGDGAPPGGDGRGAPGTCSIHLNITSYQLVCI